MSEGQDEAFERLCCRCDHLLPHPLFVKLIHTEGPTFEVIEEDKTKGATCMSGLRPLTTAGADCPYFVRKAVTAHAD